MFITEGPIVADAIEFAPDSQNGAVVSFTGVVRSHDGGRRVTGIYYDCYRAIAEREVAAMVKDIRATFGVDSAEAAALAEGLEQWLGRTIPLDLVWEWASAREIAGRVADHFHLETV